MPAVNLSLLIGPVPVAAPRALVEALSEVMVHAGSGDTPGGFELGFDLPAHSPLRTLFLLSGGGSLPLMRVVLVVTLGGRAESLIDGVATHVQTRPGEGGVGKLVVQGTDMSAVMRLIEFNGLPYPAMPPAARVLLVLAKYAAFGVVPMVIPQHRRGRADSRAAHSPAARPRLRLLAAPGPAGRLCVLPGARPGARHQQGLLGPGDPRRRAPQPALNVDMDGLTNVEQLSFRFDKEAKSMPIVFFQEPNSKAPIGIPIPDVSPLNPPLGLVPPLPVTLTPLADTANLSPMTALMTGLAYAGQHSDSVFGDGRLDVARYGRVLKSRQLVGVRGAGMAFDGLYYVQRVTHEIKRGEYKQSFTLARNALVSTVPNLPA